MSFLLDISAELIAGTIIFVLGFFWAKVPKSIERYRLRKFFGEAILGDNCRIVFGVLTKPFSQSAKDNDKFYEKRFHDGRVIKIPLFKQIVGYSTMHSHSFLLHGLASLGKKSFTICTDEEALNDLNNTFICVGGPISNGLTEWALNKEPTNRYLNFSIPDVLYEEPVTIYVSSYPDKKLSFESTEGIDYGMILKIRNSRFPNHFYFVCAGIRDSGTVGATWYLSKHWKSLYKKFGTNEFGVVLKVNRGVVTSATQVYPK